MTDDSLQYSATGGTSWTKVENPCTSGTRNPFSFVSLRTGWILCGWDGAAGAMSKRLFRTDDGGRNWRMLGEALLGRDPDHKEDKEWPEGLPLADYSGGITFVDEQHGWFFGVRYGSLYTTADGGITWNSLGGNEVRGGGLEVLTATTAFRFGVGATNVVRVTTDGGKSWRQIYPIQRSQELFYLDARTYIGVLESSLYRTNDGGRTWAELARFPAGEEPVTVFYTSAAQAWALTAAGEEHRRLYTSDDGGATWALASDSPQLNGMSVIRPVNARFAVLWDEGPTLLVTRDGGATLEKAEPPYDQYGGHGFDMRSPESGRFSRSFLLHRTETGPGAWQIVPMQEQQEAQGVALTPDGRVWALVIDVSDTDTPVSLLLSSSDEGKTWVRHDLSAFRGASSLTRCGLSSLCLGGADGEIVSHDGGLTWARRNK